jgi:TolB protein
MRTLVVSGLLTISLAAAVATPALATTAGSNGQITYDRTTDPTTGAKEVLVANPDGRNEQVLIPTNPVSCCAGFSPDGTKLAFPYPTADGRIGPAIINAEGTGYSPFPIGDPTLNVGCGTGAWAPDGKRLACESWDDTNPARDGIYTISSVDGSELTRLTNSNGFDDIPGSYSPDGKQLAFGRFDWNGVGVGLFVTNTDGTHVRRITPPGTIIQVANTGDWSPQGNEIIFSRHINKTVRGSIWVVNANGGGLRPIHISGLECGARFSDPTGFGCHEPRWSPDGKKIIFAANSPSTGTNIYIANADGTGLTQVTQDGASDDPAWGTHPATG